MQSQAHTLDVPEKLWQTLSTEEKIKISEKFEIQLHTSGGYGVLVDAQVLNKSTSATTAGASLGSAYGQANYIDRAFSGNQIDYSAKKQLGAAVLGAVVGSMFDRSAESKIVTRYTIKTNENEIKYIEEISKTSGFVHSNGICVLLNPVRPASQELCSMTKQELMLKSELGYSIDLKKNNQNVDNNIDSQTSTQRAEKVKCKIGDNPPTFLDKNLCVNANGVIK